MKDHDERALYAKALGEMLASLPDDEVVARVFLDRSPRPDQLGGLRCLTPCWGVITVVPVASNGIRETTWRGRLDLNTNTWKLDNLGFQYMQL